MVSIIALASLLAAAEPVAEMKVKFHDGAYADAVAKAASKESLVFVDFYTDW